MIPGPMELLVILVIILVLFGAGRIPDIAENLAKGIKSFKQGLKDNDDDKPAAVQKKTVKKSARKKAE